VITGGRGRDPGPKRDDRRLLQRGNDKTIEGLDHRQLVDEGQLPEQQIAGLHVLRKAAFGDGVLLLRHDIPQDHADPRIARYHLEECKRGGQQRLKIAAHKRFKPPPFGGEISRGGDDAVQRCLHNLGVLGIGRPEMEEPRHEELDQWRIGIERNAVKAGERIPGLVQCRRAIAMVGKAQHFGRKAVELRTQPVPGEIGGPGRRRWLGDETAMLVFPSAAAGAGIVAARFHGQFRALFLADDEDLVLTDGFVGSMAPRRLRGVMFQAQHEPHRITLA
jgi:hypothetical protein